MDYSGKAILWVCSGAQDSESERFSSLWEYVARRLAADDLASWEVWEVCLHCLVFWMVTGGRRLYSAREANVS